MNGPKTRGQWRRLAQVFTRPLISAVAREGSAAPLRDALCAAGVPSAKGPIGPILDGCLASLQEHYPCEYVYKAALADHTVFGSHCPRTASLHVEQPVGRSIADVAVFNSTSTAFEVKTEFDSDRRLASQASDYLKAFEQVYVVTHPEMADRIVRTADPAVGILTLGGQDRLTVVRSAHKASDRLDRDTLFRMLRVPEYKTAIADLRGPQPDMPNGERFGHYSRQWAELTLEQAHGAVVDALRARTTRPEIAEFVMALPRSLRVLGYATPLSRPQRQRLLKALVWTRG